ncbi:UDP-N-acetylglucosamine 2-epimerase (non-hydrolyzing) [Salinimicrobium sp. CDJ15-91]|uniref:UDP-N-acetylglucosamine 2-epimerase (non-hydrolyzing) n=2 Tax=Salinimicrobium oceani TaxID=2722702 RepID=A0ABX1CZH4_9FLAO|nr:UDP-N-acetylglucosamine 2-epimerase (non-hydrolyzing) [Salinimicrobium oceani]
MAPILHELKDKNILHCICVTAQHREMLDQVLEFFKIIPDYDLNIMSKGQSLNLLSSKIFEEIDLVLEKEKPELILLQGDTTTAAIASMAAFHRKIKVGHVEAGLRTYDASAPFPEEINRQIIARITDYHFVPTPAAAKNLISEGIPENKIFLTGNTVVDALLWGIKKVNESISCKEINELEKIIDPSKKIVLVTGHRRENFGTGLKEICQGLLEISQKESIQLIFPVHLNPIVKDTVHELLSGQENIHLINPLPYPAMLWLMQQSHLIISDSGGIQEEAPTFLKPVLVTRKTTERMEGVDAGFSFMVGTNKNKLISKAFELLKMPPDYSNKKNPYGDGKAAEKIVRLITSS